MSWWNLPEGLRAQVTAALGAAPVSEEIQTGGFSPGVASRLTLVDGRRVFVKAISPARNPVAPDLYRRELSVMRRMPEHLPVPRLLWAQDDGDWVILAMECIDGRMPEEPWSPDELDRVVGAVDELAAALSPAPMRLRPLVEDLAENYTAWRTFAERGADPALPSWAVRNVGLLAALEAGWTRAAAGESMVHSDLRADNLLLTSDGGVSVVDWSYAVAGAPWFDLLTLLVSAAATGTDPQREWEKADVARGAGENEVNAVLAAMAGDYLSSSLLPAPSNMPGLRAHQGEKGRAALIWLRHRL
ncbi:aminoglycoside phosphotransferase family protein [Actinocorallia libanotica]|uniref:Protein kinase domain-containing protein n=1 Tax=Actinocorallia libanotica TaxID=46162 RepID=A0ABN1R2T5_9ACTN